MLFGHQDNPRPAKASTGTAGKSDELATTFAGKAPDLDPSGTAGLPSIPENFEADAPADSASSALNQDTPAASTPATPTSNSTPADSTDDAADAADTTPEAETPAETVSVTKPEAKSEIEAEPKPEAKAEPTPARDEVKSFDPDLLSLKQQALAQLEPLVDKLDQTPEEKFRTTMMLIQGADNQALIQTAYEAAQQITDEKAKAQALLDVVNEINYFAQKEKANQ